MEVRIHETLDEIGVRLADLIEALLTREPTAVLGLATGSSPLPAYRELIRRHRDEGLSFAAAQAFLLDEYLGLEEGHPASYRSVIRAEFTEHVDLPDAALHCPPTAEHALRSGADTYDEAIEHAGGIDLQVLGIGGDGHIAFNEPGSSLASRTRLKTLSHQTRSDNARFFGDDLDAVPRHVVTQGIATILAARHLVLVAAGEDKAAAVAAAIEGPVSAMVPASALQLHPHATILLDEAAASRLTLLPYFREVQAHKPPWQSS